MGSGASKADGGASGVVNRGGGGGASEEEEDAALEEEFQRELEEKRREQQKKKEGGGWGWGRRKKENNKKEEEKKKEPKVLGLEDSDDEHGRKKKGAKGGFKTHALQSMEDEGEDIRELDELNRTFKSIGLPEASARESNRQVSSYSEGSQPQELRGQQQQQQQRQRSVDGGGDMDGFVASGSHTRFGPRVTVGRRPSVVAERRPSLVAAETAASQQGFQGKGANVKFSWGDGGGGGGQQEDEWTYKRVSFVRHQIQYLHRSPNIRYVPTYEVRVYLYTLYPWPVGLTLFCSLF